MKNRWDTFFKEKIEKIFKDKKEIVDIGGGLRLDASHNNRVEENEWIKPLLSGVNYRILDKVSDFNPDVVGDIHNLPFKDGSVDAVICMAVLEHVEDPKRAMEEVYRVLKPGGYAFIYAPFLYYYHAEAGYYGDFYRYTDEGLRYLSRQFSQIELCAVRGPIATAMNLFPFFSKRTGIFDWFDRILRPHSKQVSGYHMFCIK